MNTNELCEHRWVDISTLKKSERMCLKCRKVEPMTGSIEETNDADYEMEAVQEVPSVLRTSDRKAANVVLWVISGIVIITVCIILWTVRRMV